MSIYKCENIGALLANNTYPGRGIVTGKSADGKCAVIAYFIMGRSENSRNRVFSLKGNDVVTEPFDYDKVADPSLIIYSAIRGCGKNLIVTNGDQTDTIHTYLEKGGTMREALATREFEPDPPNLTPRISSVLTFDNDDFNYEMSILKSADAEGTACNRYYYEYRSLPAVGHFIHTYVTDGNPIPTFQGEPERVEIPNDIDEFTNNIWENLNESNKISLYVRYINLRSGMQETRLINKNQA